MFMSIQQKKMQRGRRSKYPPEFRRDAVGLVLDEGRTIADVARSLGAVGEGTLGNWVSKERDARGVREGLSGDEREELVELRAKCAKLSMERDLLKRSLAFWINETSTL
jgi:transposase